MIRSVAATHSSRLPTGSRLLTVFITRCAIPSGPVTITDHDTTAVGSVITAAIMEAAPPVAAIQAEEEGLQAAEAAQEEAVRLPLQRHPRGE